MKTPFDGAIRVGQREIDEVRIAISVQVDRLVRLETDRIENERATHRERAVATDDALLSSHAYLNRMRMERVRLKDHEAVVDQQLTQLRAEAVKAYGTLKAIATAADGWREEAERAAAKAEQSNLDDLASASFARDQHNMRKGGR